MCGISCFVTVSPKRRPVPAPNGGKSYLAYQAGKEASRLDRSVESMRHRGPDAKGVWTSDDFKVGLGHVRLSTRDLSSAGNQPLHSVNAEHDIHAVVNGELYYDEQLRTSLSAEGYEFQSSSDSEMVIPLYQKYGPSFVEHLRGEFSFVLYDREKQVLVAARDRFGVKPLYYGVFDGQLLMSSQCKGIMELLPKGTTLRWDARCLAQGGGHYGSRTLFEGIRKFPPAHYLVVQVGQHQQRLEFQRYWNFQFPANQGHADERSATELVEELRARLLNAVRLRLESTDTKVGILLSGGVDSSAVAGMVAHLLQEKERQNGVQGEFAPPTCFTIKFPDDDKLDESAIAQRTAEQLSLPWEPVTITEQDLADNLEDTCWLGEVPMWDLQHVAKKALSRHVSAQGFKVVLNGDGSDELFAGYPFFVADRLAADDEVRTSSLQEVSSEQREKVREEYTKNLAWFGAERSEKSSKGMDCKDSNSLHLPETYRNIAVVRFDDWLRDEVLDLSNTDESMAELFTQAERNQMATYHPVHRDQLAFIKTLLPNLVIAAISDGAEMAHSVESRPPILDHVVAEFAQTLAPDMLVHLDEEEGPIEKWIFREAVKPFVPEEVYAKRKHAFAAPFRYAIGGPLYNKLSSIITTDNVDRLGVVDPNKSKDIVQRAFEQKDQVLFRKAIWLAQIITLGTQFDVETWESPRVKKADRAPSCTCL